MGISTEELRGLIPPEHPFWIRLERLYGPTTTVAPTTPPPPSTITSEFDSTSNSSRFDAEAVIGKFLSRTRRAFMSHANNLNSRRIGRFFGKSSFFIYPRRILYRRFWRCATKLERYRHYLFRLRRSTHGCLKVKNTNTRTQSTKFPISFLFNGLQPTFYALFPLFVQSNQPLTT